MERYLFIKRRKKRTVWKKPVDKSSYPQCGDKIGEKPVDNCG